MKPNESEIIKQNIRVLVKLYNKQIPLLDKIEIIEQLMKNLEYLKSQIPDEEYKSKYKKTEEDLNLFVKKVTDKNFIDNFIKKINSVLTSEAFKGLKKSN